MKLKESTRLYAMMKAGRVTRLHTYTTLGHYNVASHVFGMMVLADFIYGDRHIPSRIHRAILYHDMHEVTCGDVPYHVRKSPQVREGFDSLEKDENDYMNWNVKLNKNEQLILDAIDMLEFMFYVLHERKLGNTTLSYTFDAASHEMSRSPITDMPEIRDLLEHVQLAFHEANQ